MSGAGAPMFICNELQLITDKFATHKQLPRFNELVSEQSSITESGDFLERIALCQFVNELVIQYQKSKGPSHWADYKAITDITRSTLTALDIEQRVRLTEAQFIICQQTRAFFKAALDYAIDHEPTVTGKELHAARMLGIMSKRARALPESDATP